MRYNEILVELKKVGLKAGWKVINKNGTLHTGIVIESGGQVAPIIYTDGLIDERDDLDMAVNKILGEYQKVRDVSFDVKHIINRDYILGHITIAVQKDGKENLIKKKTELDGIESYLIVMDDSMSAEGNLSMKVSLDLLDECRISESEAWERAKKNLHESVQIKSMSQIMAEMIGEEFEEVCGVDDKMFVISTKSGVKGAAAVLDKESMEAFAKKHHATKVAVLPSSIHEMILVTGADESEERALSAMVTDVNTTEVRPEERLTNKAYFMEF